MCAFDKGSIGPGHLVSVVNISFTERIALIHGRLAFLYSDDDIRLYVSIATSCSPVGSVNLAPLQDGRFHQLESAGACTASPAK